MSSLKIKLDTLDLSVLVTIASTTLYLVFRMLGRELGSFAFLWAPLTLLIIFFKHPAVYTWRPMKLLIFYGVLMIGVLQLLLWNNMDDWNQPRILAEFYFLLIFTLILSYYWSLNKLRKLALLSKWALIFIFISLIGTNIALFIDPMIVRQSAASGDFSALQGRIYKFTGAMSYSYSQAVIFLIPIIIYHIKNKKGMVFEPKVLIMLLLLIIVTQVRSQVFANVLVTMVITIVSWMGLKRIRASVFALSLLSLLVIIIPTSYYVDLLFYFSSKFNPGSEMQYKLTDFAIFLKYPEIDTSTGAGARAERYPMLFDALMRNPLFGNASYNSSINIMQGAHLYWMNRLALWGIPGFLFFLFVLYKLFRSISTLFDSEYKFYYFLSIASLVLIGSLKTVGGSEPWLMLIVVIPGLYFLPLLEQKSAMDSRVIINNKHKSP